MHIDNNFSPSKSILFVKTVSSVPCHFQGDKFSTVMCISYFNHFIFLIFLRYFSFSKSLLYMYLILNIPTNPNSLLLFSFSFCQIPSHSETIPIPFPFVPHWQIIFLYTLHGCLAVYSEPISWQLFSWLMQWCDQGANHTHSNIAHTC